MTDFTCAHCNVPTVVTRVSYIHNGNLYMGVPVRVCVNPDCVKKFGAEVVVHRTSSKPRQY